MAKLSYDVSRSVVACGHLTLWACGVNEEDTPRFYRLTLNNLGETTLQTGTSPEEVLQTYIDKVTPHTESYAYVWILSDTQRLLEWWKEIEGEWAWN